MLVNKLFADLPCTYLKGKGCFNVKSSTHYFHVKTKRLIFNIFSRFLDSADLADLADYWQVSKYALVYL